MANDHPFQTLFETFGRAPASHAELVNRRAFETMADLLTVPVEQPGRCILLRAPRAGHGKTHLLSRIQHQLGATSEFIPLLAAGGARIDAATVTDDTLRRLGRQLPASGGLTVLDLVTRRLFASALQPLVASGEVPCQDREGALSALRSRPIETFDFHHPTAVTAHWARENFEVLGQRLSMELAHRAEVPASDVAFWVEGLFQFASAPLENTARVGTLMETVRASTGAEMERLVALLGLLTLLTRVVLVADDLEGFSADETAALRLAAFLGALRQAVVRVDVILSLNDDVWQSAFLPRLSDGLADRLSEIVVELEPLTKPEMLALLESRAPGLGERIFERLDVINGGEHARGLIRSAGVAWVRAAAQAATAVPSAPDETVSPPTEPVAESVEEPDIASEPLPFIAAPAAEEPPPAWPEPGFADMDDVFVPRASVFSKDPLDDPFGGADWDEAFPVSTPFALESWEIAETASSPPPATFTLPEDSPFIAVPFDDAPETPAEPSPFSIPESERAPIFDPPVVDTPFKAMVQEEKIAAPETPVEPPVPASAKQPADSPAETDRVDDLLRQFRERYGRGSL